MTRDQPDCASLEPPCKAVLFVDDEPRVLQGLERMLRPLRHDWTMTFVASGSDALDALDHNHFDVLVTDMRMSGMSGIELLEQVLDRHPHVIRIALSGHAEREVIIRAARLAHQYVTKPCDGTVIRDKLAQAMRLQVIMRDSHLQKITSQVLALRAVPAIYLDLMAEMQLPEPSVMRIAAIVASDPAMTAKVLQLVNSAFFGLRTHVSDPELAVRLLGTETIRALVLSVQVYSRFKGRSTGAATIWPHVMRTARLARAIARDLRLDETGQHEAFTAGLLHDVGKLVLAEALPEYTELTRAPGADWPPVAVEQERFGATHAEVGAYLLGLWGLPYAIVEAVAWHHRPSAGGLGAATPLTAVHCANVIDHELHATQGTGTCDDEYIDACGVRADFPRWRDAAANVW